jgi:WD40 repeat protein
VSPVSDAPPVGTPLPGQAAAILCLAFSGAGDLVAAAGADGLIVVWDVDLDRPAIRARLLGHTESVHAVAFAPDASALASGDAHGRFKLWDLAAPNGERSLGQFGDRIDGLAGARDGRLAVVGGDRARIWDAVGHAPRELVPAAGPVPEWEGPDPASPSALRFLSRVALSADGALVAIGSSDSRVVVREAATGRVLHAFDGVPPRLYGPADPREALNRAEYKRVVGALAFAPDASLLAAGYGWQRMTVADYDQLIRVWSLRDGREVATLKVGNSVRALHFTRDGHALIAACNQPAIRAFSTATWEPVGPPILAGDRIQSATLSPDEGRLAAGLRSGELTVWERATGRPIGRAPAHSGAVTSVAFTPDGRIMATSRIFERTLILWEADTLRELLTLPLDGAPWAMDFAPRGDALLVAQEGDLRIWPAWPLDRIDAERAAERDRDSREPAGPAPTPPSPSADIPAARLAALGGDYRLSPEVVFHLDATSGVLRLSFDGGATTLRPVSPTEFVALDGGARVHLDGDADGRPARLILVQDGRRFECPRDEPPGRAGP